MLPLQYDRPYIWCPSIYSRPFELYPLYKCRARHQVFSKVTLSQGAARLNQHYMASAEHIIGRTHSQQNTTVGRIQQLAEYNSWQNTQLAEHIIGKIGLSAKLSAKMSAEHTVGRTHSRQNTTVSRRQQSAEYTVGRTQQWHNMLSAIYHRHNELWHYTM